VKNDLSAVISRDKERALHESEQHRAHQPTPTPVPVLLCTKQSRGQY
jgi:hypothetical protein